jgi:hypothetical protein
VAVEVGTGAVVGTGVAVAVVVAVTGSSRAEVGDGAHKETRVGVASRGGGGWAGKAVQAATNKMMACHIAPVQFFRKKGSPIPGPFTGPYQTETALPTARIELRLDPQDS